MPLIAYLSNYFLIVFSAQAIIKNPTPVIIGGSIIFGP
jgi:hypothetical protein